MRLHACDAKASRGGVLRVPRPYGAQGEGEDIAAEDSRLTLQGLAQRLEALERENAELRREVGTLRGLSKRQEEVVNLSNSEPLRSGRPTPESPEPEERVSRK
jgi:hypothetical protein